MKLLDQMEPRAWTRFCYFYVGLGLTKPQFGQTTCTIHADNCRGKNMNQHVIGYFMWRVMTTQHNRMEFKMQIPGHARSLIDGGFALLKKLYRRCDCDSLCQLEDVVNRSSTTNTAVYQGQFFQTSEWYPPVPKRFVRL